ncbi:MAG: arginine--tRNA ligase, partial [Rickettsiales bacterium]|nr:arginine--tRNA ligase [Rickettsiales bacterium]
MNIFSVLKEEIISSLKVYSGLSDAALYQAITIELPKDPSHGDLSTNAAMVLSKVLGQNPRQIAEALVSALRKRAEIASVTIAGPGFINMTFHPSFWQAQIPIILSAGLSYGDSAVGQGEAVNVEYVSANPTGPMHIGHARGAVVGDALARLLEKAGFSVTREYYVNDAGAQTDVLARSVYLR